MQKLQYPLNIDQTKQQLNSQDWLNIDDKLPALGSSMYTFQPNNPQHKLYYRRLVFVLNNLCQQYQNKAYILSKYMLCINTNNYYAMMLRNQCRKKLILKATTQQQYMQQLYEQINFANALLIKNSKQYQVWNYKKDIISDAVSSMGQQAKNQLKRRQDQFLFHIMTNDQERNYHAWDYMIYLATTIGNLENSIKHTQNMIFFQTTSQNNQVQCQALWKNCYSCWSYRFNLILELPAQKRLHYIRQDCQRIHNFVLKNPQNQCGWNYLTGLLQLKDLKQQQKLSVINHIYEVCKQVKGDNKYAWTFLLNLGSEEVKKEALQKLIIIDPIRKLYYQFLKQANEC